MKFQQIDRQCSKIIQTIFIEQRKIKSAPLAIHYGSLLFYFMIPSFVVLFLCVYLGFHLDRVCVCVFVCKFIFLSFSSSFGLIVTRRF